MTDIPADEEPQAAPADDAAPADPAPESAPESAPEAAVEDEAEVATVVETPVEEEAAAPEPVAAPARAISKAHPAWGVGRRKSSSARVRMFPGRGEFTVNGRQLEDYFPHEVDRRWATEPLSKLPDERTEAWDVHVTVRGGGTTGQSGAVRHGVARALLKAEPSLEPALRQANMMTRDARVAERKKYGRRGARRGFQFSKR